MKLSLKNILKEVLERGLKTKMEEAEANGYTVTGVVCTKCGWGYGHKEGQNPRTMKNEMCSNCGSSDLSPTVESPEGGRGIWESKQLKEVSDEEGIQQQALELADPKGELRWEIKRLKDELESGWGGSGVQFDQKEMWRELTHLENTLLARIQHFSKSIESGQIFPGRDV